LEDEPRTGIAGLHGEERIFFPGSQTIGGGEEEDGDEVAVEEREEMGRDGTEEGLGLDKVKGLIVGRAGI